MSDDLAAQRRLRAEKALARVHARTEASRRAAGKLKPEPKPEHNITPYHELIAATVEDTARYLGCTVTEVKDLIAQRRIRAFGVGPRQIRVIVASVLDFKLPPPSPIPPGTMSGKCGACITTCALCKKIANRSRSYIPEHEALEILSCGKGVIASNANVRQVRREDGTHYHYDDICALKQARAVSSTTKRAERQAVTTQIDVLIQRRREAHAIVNEWLREASLLPSNGGIIYGRRVMMSSPPSTGWYVYHLCRPNGKTFYVGKGKHKRMYQHVIEARKGVDSYKCNLIRRIWKKGQDILYRVVFVSTSEEEVYAVERSEIAAIGLVNLTNIEPGGLSSKEAGRMMGFDVQIAYLDVSRVKQWIHWYYNQTWIRRTPSDEDMRRHYRTWAEERTSLLRDIRTLALQVHHTEAIAIIDAELDQLAYYRANQIGLFDSYDRHRLRVRHVSFHWIDEWDYWEGKRKERENQAKPKGRRKDASQLRLDEL